MSIYQTEEWKKVLEASGFKFAEIEGMNAFENNIISIFGTKKIIFARGSPSESALRNFKEKAKKYSYGTITPKITDFKDSLFKKSGFKKYDDFTIMIDLKKSEEELFQQLEKKSVRWGVKTAEKNNLMFFEAEKPDLGEFYEIYADTSLKGGLHPEPFAFFEKSFQLLVPRNLAKIFVIRKDSKIIAGCILLIDSDHTMLHLSGANDQGYKLQAMPFLYWNIIKYSKKIGKKYIDLGGFDAEAREGEKTYFINRFKTNFGGEVWAQPIYVTSWKYIFARTLMHYFRIIKKVYRKERTAK